MSGVDLVEDVYRLTPVQEGMLFHVLEDGSPSLYREQGTARLDGDLDAGALEAAWRSVVARHGALRTGFHWHDLPRPVQMVERRVELPFDQLDWRHLAPEEEARELERLLADDRRRPGSLDRPPLMRLVLARTGGQRHRLLWSIHHLIHDAWSLAVLLDEVLVLYRARLEGRRAELPPAPPYRSLVAWLARRDDAADEAFWRRNLAGLREPTPLPGGAAAPRRGPSADPEPFGHRERRLGSERVARLEAAGRSAGVTVGTLVQAAWTLVLATGAETASEPLAEVLFGTVVAGRPEGMPGVERAVGLFINTLPLRVPVAREAPAAAWLRDCQARVVALRGHEHAPLQKLGRWSEMAPGRQLFDSIVVVQNAFTGVEGRSAGGLTIREVRAVGHPSYPLTLRVTPLEGPDGRGLWLEILHDPARVAPPLARRLLEQVDCLLAALAEAGGRSVGWVLARAERIGSERGADEEYERHRALDRRLRATRPRRLAAAAAGEEAP